MRRFIRVWGVSVAAWAAVLTLTGAAIAGALDTPEPALSLSPEGVVDGKTLESGEPFEMTLHLEADAGESYDLLVSYAGGAVGTCQADAATLETNPEGKAVWTCELATATNDGAEAITGTVAFSVTQDGAEVVSIVATLSVADAEEDEVAEEEPVEEEPVEEPVEEVSDGLNHGHCVSHWSHRSREEGLEGSARGHFVSSVAQDPDAVAPKGDDPGGACDFSDELAEALAAQLAEEQSEQAEDAAAVAKHGKGKPEK